MRKVITPKLRFQVLNRNNFICQKGDLKNDFSIKKFSYFFNEISNG